MRVDPNLSEISHIILDEVHERDLFTDVLLGVLKSTIKNSGRMKIIVMSASLDTDLFKNFFGCPCLEVPGRTFKVQRHYLEDFIDDISAPLSVSTMADSMSRLGILKEIAQPSEYMTRYGNRGQKMYQFENGDSVNVQFIVKLIQKIHRDFSHDKSGAILVFLPGWDDISNIEYSLTTEVFEDGKDNADYLDDVQVFTLHSQVDMSKQVQVFRPPQKGLRKVILSTNIAETSVTIDDVVYVIDCGRLNVMRYQPLQKASNLNVEWISKSNSQQRAGRAGRVQKGQCWHLFSRLREETLPKFLDPDIKRQQLEEVVLSIKSLSLPFVKIEAFMQYLVEAPNATSVMDAIDLLTQIGALDNLEKLTPLGAMLSRISLNPQLGKMVLLACFFK